MFYRKWRICLTKTLLPAIVRQRTTQNSSASHAISFLKKTYVLNYQGCIRCHSKRLQTSRFLSESPKGSCVANETEKICHRQETPFHDQYAACARTGTCVTVNLTFWWHSCRCKPKSIQNVLCQHVYPLWNREGTADISWRVLPGIAGAWRDLHADHSRNTLALRKSRGNAACCDHVQGRAPGRAPLPRYSLYWWYPGAIPPQLHCGVLWAALVHVVYNA